MEYISAADTNKIVRNALKDAFPAIKFSVKLTSGGSCRISWVDGPTESQVKAVVSKFAGASFDPMIDLKSYNVSHFNGEQVSFGIDFIFTNRSYSEAGQASIMAAYVAKYGPYDANDYSNERWMYALKGQTQL